MYNAGKINPRIQNARRITSSAILDRNGECSLQRTAIPNQQTTLSNLTSTPIHKSGKTDCFVRTFMYIQCMKGEHFNGIAGKVLSVWTFFSRITDAVNEITPEYLMYTN